MHEFSQARTLESIAISSSRGSSLLRDQYQGEETLVESNLPGSGSEKRSPWRWPVSRQPCTCTNASYLECVLGAVA